MSSLGNMLGLNRPILILSVLATLKFDTVSVAYFVIFQSCLVLFLVILVVLFFAQYC